MNHISPLLGLSACLYAHCHLLNHMGSCFFLYVCAYASLMWYMFIHMCHASLVCIYSCKFIPLMFLSPWECALSDFCLSHFCLSFTASMILNLKPFNDPRCVHVWFADHFDHSIPGLAVFYESYQSIAGPIHMLLDWVGLLSHMESRSFLYICVYAPLMWYMFIHMCTAPSVCIYSCIFIPVMFLSLWACALLSDRCPDACLYIPYSCVCFSPCICFMYMLTICLFTVHLCSVSSATTNSLYSFAAGCHINMSELSWLVLISL